MKPLQIGRMLFWPDWYWRCWVCRVESMPLVSWQHAFDGLVGHCALPRHFAAMEEADRGAADGPA